MGQQAVTEGPQCLSVFQINKYIKYEVLFILLVHPFTHQIKQVWSMYSILHSEQGRNNPCCVKWNKECHDGKRTRCNRKTQQVHNRSKSSQRRRPWVETWQLKKLISWFWRGQSHTLVCHKQREQHVWQSPEWNTTLAWLDDLTLWEMAEEAGRVKLQKSW